MKIKIREETLYFLFISILVLIYMFEGTSWNGFSNSFLHDALQMIAIIAIFLYIIIKRYSLKELAPLLIIYLIGVSCFVSSGYTGLLMTMLAITLLPKGKLDDVLHMMLIEESLIFVIIIILSQVGILSNEIMSINKNYYVTNALSLGFEHPNMLAAQASSIIFLFLCVKRNAIKRVHVGMALLGICIVYFLSKGRSSLLLGIFAIVLITFRKKKWLNNFLYKILPWMYIIVIFMVGSFMAIYAILGSDSIFVDFINNSLFNGRIGLAYRSLLVYPVTMFGRPLDFDIWNEWQYYSLDNGQVMILLEYGIAGFIGYFWIIQKTLKHIKEEGESIFAIVLIVFLIWSMYEGTMYFIGKNFALLFLGTDRLNDFVNKKKKNEV